MKACKKYIQEIAEYIDGEIDESLCADLVEHLKTCSNCRIMVDTLKQTVVLSRDGKIEKLPDELESKLNLALKKKWQQNFKGKDGSPGSS
jgi:anti-sigma factor RsiW